MTKTPSNFVVINLNRIFVNLAALSLLCGFISLGIEFFAREFFRLS